MASVVIVADTFVFLLRLSGIVRTRDLWNFVQPYSETILCAFCLLLLPFRRSF